MLRIFCFLSLAFVLLIRNSPAEQPKQPNIVVFLADDK